MKSERREARADWPLTSYLSPDAPSRLGGSCYAVKLLPQPQPPVALGLVKVKPEPCMDVT